MTRSLGGGSSRSTVKLCGRTVRLLRKCRGWSQEELAAAVGYSDRWVRKVEAGQPINCQSAVDLAAALSTPSEVWQVHELIESPVALARRFVNALFGRQTAALDELLKPDVAMTYRGDDPHPLAGTCRGLAEVTRRLEWYRSHCPEHFQQCPTYFSNGGAIIVHFMHRFDAIGQRSISVWTDLQLLIVDDAVAELDFRVDTLNCMRLLERRRLAGRRDGLPG